MKALAKNVLPQDIEIAESIKKAAEKERPVDNQERFYQDFRKALEVPKTWEEKETVKIDKDSEYFTYKARKYADELGHTTQIISFFEGDTLNFGLIFRDYLILNKESVEFYQDVLLDYYLITVNGLITSPWRYVKF